MLLSDQRRPSINLDVVHDIFLAFAGNNYQINCAVSTPEPALRFRQDKINYVLEKTGEHEFGQHFACYREKGDATTVATFCSSCSHA